MARSELEIDEGSHAGGSQNFDEANRDGHGSATGQGRPAAELHFKSVAPARRGELAGKAQEQDDADGCGGKCGRATGAETAKDVEGDSEGGGAEEDPSRADSMKEQDARYPAPGGGLAPQAEGAPAGAIKSLRPDAVSDEKKTVQAAPDDECPCCPVPQSTQQHGDHQVDAGAQAA